MKFLLNVLPLLFLAVDAFAPIKAPNARPSIALRAEESVDAFSAYEQTPTQGLAVREDILGTGEVAEKDKVVTVAYKGRLMASGKEFDFNDAYSFKLGVGNVLPGWDQGLEGMRVGGKRTLRIPPRLAFDDQWHKGEIPPNSHLEFDVELLSIADNPFMEALLPLNMKKEQIIGFPIVFALFAILGR